MKRGWVKRCGLVLGMLAGPLAAQPDAALSIGGEPFGQSEILDARGLPSIDGKPVIMVTFDDAAGRRFQDLIARLVDRPVSISINGQVIASPVIPAPASGNVIEINGAASMEEATRLAKLISGKDPLPDSLEEGAD